MTDRGGGHVWHRRAPAVLLWLSGLAILAGLAIRLILLVQPIGGDPGIYAYIGGRILGGELPFRDVFEQKPPGILYTYAAAFWLFGRSMLAVQLLDLLAWAVLVVLAAGLAWSMWRDRAVTAVAGALAALFVNPTLQSSFRQVGQTETILAVWAGGALWLAIRSSRAAAAPGQDERPAGSGAAWVCGAGLCCGIAFLYKYNALTYFVACAAVLALSPGRRRTGARFGALVAAFVVVPAIVVLYFWARGGLADLYVATVLYNISYTAGTYPTVAAFAARAATMTYRFLTMDVVWFAGACGVLAIVVRAWRGERSGLPIVMFVAAAYLAMLANAKFYPQYFLQILPPLIPCAAFALVLACRAVGRRPQAVVAGIFLAGVLWVGVRHVPAVRLAADVAAAARYAAGTLPRDDYYLRFGGFDDGGGFSLVADVRLAAMIEGTTRPEDTIYIYGGEPLVLFLSGRRSASRFIWNDPFLSGGFRGRYTTADLVGEMEAAKPAFFIVIRNDQNMIDPVDSLTHFRQDRQLQDYVSREYREAGRLEDFLLYRRKDR